MKHDKQCGSGNSLSTWLCVGACAAPAVTLALFFPGSQWLSAALMLAVCGGAHFLMTRSTAAGEQSAVKRLEEGEGARAPEAVVQASESEVIAPAEMASSPERQTRDAA